MTTGRLGSAPLVIDTDAGVDDAVALLLALGTPTPSGVALRAITATYGNCALAQVVANVCTVLDVCDADVPVYAGAHGPLLGGWDGGDGYFGADGMGAWAVRPVASARAPHPEHAALALIRLAHVHAGALVLATIGPLTNVALTCALDPTFPARVARLVVMGGASGARGNAPAFAAEYNFYTDPEAAAAVLRAFPHTTLIDWQLNRASGLPEAHHARLAASAHRAPTSTAA